MKKFLRLAQYAKEMLLIMSFKLLGRISSKFLKDVWLVSERGNDARDNGYWFYKFLKENHPSIKSFFVITNDSEDYEKAAKLGNTVKFRSFKHYFLYFTAEHLIGTHVQPCAPDKVMYYHLAKMGIRPRGKQTFLQHGITKDDMRWLDAEHLYIDLFVCGARPEYEEIKNTYNHPEGVVQYLGLARFDNLIKADKKEKMILVMPTWRGASYHTNGDFKESAYFKRFNSFLNNKDLSAMLEKYDYTLVFYPHTEMQKYIALFGNGSKRVVIADKSSYDVQELLMNCAMLVTDYSSVFFDAAFLKKPMVYYQFDEEEYHLCHYKKGYFDFREDGFGEVVTEEKELTEAIQRCFDSKMTPDEKYQKRAERFFELHDDKNCERIYDAVCKIKKE